MKCWRYTLNIRLNTFSAVGDDLLGSWDSFGFSNIILPPTQQTLSDMTCHWYTIQLTQHRKKKWNWIVFLFIWTIIDRSSAHLIGCSKQPIKYAELYILVISEDTSTFWTYGLFEIIHLHIFVYIWSILWLGIILNWIETKKLRDKNNCC